MIEKNLFLKTYNLTENDLVEAGITWEKLTEIGLAYEAIEGKLREIGKEFINDYLYDIEKAGIQKRIIAVSSPIIYSNGQVIGVLRYVTSTRLLDLQILKVFSCSMLILLLIMLAVHWFLRGKTPAAGIRFALYAFLYGSVMILMESLREDGHMVWGFVHAEMVFDLAFALPALLCLAKTKKRILLSLLATAVLAGAVVGLEFALDRSSIGDGLLYAAYIAVLGGYIFLGCTCAKKRLAV